MSNALSRQMSRRRKVLTIIAVPLMAMAMVAPPAYAGVNAARPGNDNTPHAACPTTGPKPIVALQKLFARCR